ncbi:MAG: DUF4286 family protein [Cyclobacteriaceae bacterium]
MILYNVTVNIEADVESEWMDWMKNSHIPKVMATGQFLDYKIFKLLNEEEGGGTTYSIQYFAKSLNELNHYFAEFAPALVQEHLDKYKDKHVAFRTVLEAVV